jgi:hypothetical protein
MSEFLKLDKGDKVVYLLDMPYILGNGQRVNKEGDELTIHSKVSVSKKHFNLLEEKKVEVPKIEEKVEEKAEKTLDEMNKEELLAFADSKELDVDKRKGESKLRKEIKGLLDK